MLKKLLFTFLVLTVMFITSACSSKNNKTDTQNSCEVNCYTVKNVSLDYDFYDNGDIFYINDKVYIPGIKFENCPDQRLNLIDVESGEYTELSKELVPDDTVTALYIDSGTIYIAHFNYDTLNCGIMVINRTENKIINDVMLDIDMPILSVHKDDNGRISADISDRKHKYFKITLNQETYDIIRKTDLSPANLKSTQNIIQGLYIDGKYCLIILNNNYDGFTEDLYVISEEGTQISVFYDILKKDSVFFEKICPASDGNICIVSRDSENSLLRHIYEVSVISGEILSVTEEELPDNAIFSSDEYSEYFDFLLSDEESIFLYNVYTQETEELCRITESAANTRKFELASAFENNLLVYSSAAGRNELPLLYVFDKNGDLITKTDTNYYVDKDFPIGITVLDNGNTAILFKKTSGYYFNILNEYDETINSFTVPLDPELETDPIISTGNNGKIYLTLKNSEKSSYRLLEFENNGTLLNDVEINNRNIKINQIFEINNNIFVIYDNDIKRGLVASVDSETGKLLETAINNDNDFQIIRELSETQGKIMFLTSDGIVEFELSSAKSQEVINWAETGMVCSVKSAYYIDSETIVCRNTGINGDNFSFLKKADEETIEKFRNKKVITAAGINISRNILNEIEIFNQESEEYRIILNDYSFKYDGIYEEDEFVKLLNLDIISGKIPDILLGHSIMDLQFYSHKGMFLDLKEFFKSDNDISEYDFLDNIIECFSSDEKLFYMPLRFDICAFVGKESVVGSKTDWTFDEFYTLSEKQEMFFNQSRSLLEFYLIYHNLDEFVEYSDADCSFESDKFKRLCEYIADNGIPEEEYVFELNYPKESEIYKGYYDKFRTGKAAVSYEMISKISRITSLQNGDMDGERIAYKGMVSDYNSSPQIFAGETVGICAFTENQEGAWSFVKRLLSEDYQRKISRKVDSFSINRTVFEEDMKNYPRIGYAFRTDGSFYNPEPVSDEDVMRFREIILNSHTAFSNDSTIESIISQELQLYYHGINSIDQTASIIQKKVKLYLEEIK